VAALYLAFNLAYSLGLKKQVLIDVFIIAIGFVLRAIGGVELLLPVSPETVISPWLLVCTFFGALFLALAKRRRELENAGEGAAERRAVLRQYTPELLDGLLLVSAASSLMSYALYTIWPATVAKFHTEALLYTVPFVAYGIFRYLWLVRVSSGSEDPSQVLLTDRPMATTVALYLVAVLAILYRG
jgi:4-hydroxybenzoate polyprenyltransferase